MDRVAGELSPDMEELLEAHLQQNPAARKEAAEIGETLRLARLALASQPVVALPVPRPYWHVPKWAWQMAACFVCGLLLGIFAMRGRNEPVRVTASIPGNPMASITTPDDSGIWSARRFRAGLSPASVKAENPIVWKSPVRRPEML